MPLNIEDYALIGDRETAALVGRDGSIDWLCFPRFDSPACFTAMLGDSENGRWLLAPEGVATHARRKYLEGTLVLETEYQTDTGSVRVVDCMPARGDGSHPRVLRMVEGLEGNVSMQLELVLRFDYGSVVPWVQRQAHGIVAVAGPDAVRFESDVELKGQDLRTVATFSVAKKERVTFALTWSRSFSPYTKEKRTDVARYIRETTTWWKRWSSRASYRGPHRDAVVRSLITLKALTYAPSGAIVAAPTTSLPELWGGTRNWDYRYCWLRDATFTLYALMNAGYTEEALAWRDWLLRAIAGNAGQSKAMYGIRGEGRIEEVELPWLAGFHGAKPVRIGNAVHKQLQLDVYGEVCDALFLSARTGLDHTESMWSLQTKLIEVLEGSWQQPDEGMWEVRGPRRDFTHSKVMAWVAFDRSVKMIEELGVAGPLERWRAARDRIHDEVCARGYDDSIGSFVQYYGAREVDASALLIPLVGFLPTSDKRVIGTIEQIEKILLVDGFVRRYRTKVETDGLEPGEGCFLPCSFWLADVYMLLGRHDEARALFDRLCGLTNDLGLLAEEYDPASRRFLGNFPQAFSHVALVNTARNLYEKNGPAHHRHATKGVTARPKRKRLSKRRHSK